ncbi:MAG: HepT-like ribonuclease domain-containing protein [Candidatus Thermoplasmatota archaeon]
MKGFRDIVVHRYGKIDDRDIERKSWRFL